MTDDKPSAPPLSRPGDRAGRRERSSGRGAASALEHLRELEASKARVVPLEADDRTLEPSPSADRNTPAT